MSEPTDIHLNDTPIGSGFRFMTEVIAWITGTWAVGLVHPVLGVAALVVLVGLPTVFTTKGDKKHTMIDTPGPYRAFIDFFQFAVAAFTPWLVFPDWAAALCVVTVVAAVVFGRSRFRWLLSGAPLNG